jgi:hypothetical protein
MGEMGMETEDEMESRVAGMHRTGLAEMEEAFQGNMGLETKNDDDVMNERHLER